MLGLDLRGELAVCIAQLAFAVALVVADAADVLAGLGGVKAQCVAADAGTDAVVLAGHRLVDEVGIGQPLTAYDSAVDIAAVNYLFGDLYVHTHALENRDVNLCLDLAAEVEPVGVGDFHGDKGNGGVVPACGDGEAVDKAGLIEIAADICDIVAGAAAFKKVAAADAQLDGELRADDLADSGEGLDDEAAVLVGTEVRQGRPELAVEVTGVGLKLDAVKAGSLGYQSRVCLPLDELVDLFDGQGAGHFVMGELAGNCGGADCLKAADGGSRCGGASVHDLCEDLAAALMDGVGHLLELGNIFFVSQKGNIVRVADFVPLHVCKDYQANAALSSALVEISDFIVDVAVDGVPHAHGSHDDAVLEFYPVDLNGGIESVHCFSSIFVYIKLLLAKINRCLCAF